jgi:hypothetical protein
MFRTFSTTTGASLEGSLRSIKRFNPWWMTFRIFIIQGKRKRCYLSSDTLQPSSGERVGTEARVQGESEFLKRDNKELFQENDQAQEKSPMLSL